jgi:hypothetical protein
VRGVLLRARTGPGPGRWPIRRVPVDRAGGRPGWSASASRPRVRGGRRAGRGTGGILRESVLGAGLDPAPRGRVRSGPRGGVGLVVRGHGQEQPERGAQCGAQWAVRVSFDMAGDRPPAGIWAPGVLPVGEAAREVCGDLPGTKWFQDHRGCVLEHRCVPGLGRQRGQLPVALLAARHHARPQPGPGRVVQRAHHGPGAVRRPVVRVISSRPSRTASTRPSSHTLRATRGERL